MQRIVKFPVSAERLRRMANHDDCGGIVSFEGVVRNHHDGREVVGLIYEAFASMAEREMEKLIREVESEWPMVHVMAEHRIGELGIGDAAVAIVVWAPHRREAFAACAAMIDRIKSRVPIWKKEFYRDGSHAWVACHHAGAASEK